MNHENAITVINGLYDKYEQNPYMLSKLNNYINVQLPTMLENTNLQHQERTTRIEQLTQNQDQFIENFLNNNQYFYVSSTENFFIYDGIHYQQHNEDDILYHVLSSISREKQLSSWKQSTKNTIMKRIKENNLLKSIPESETIQYVLDSLCPVLFQTRTEAKYFLTILGDNILRKNTNLIHYVSSNAKHFIRTLNSAAQMLLGQNLYQTFKHKFHDHDYNDCRVLNISTFVKSETVWSTILNNIGLDILCVACHYSLRYGSSDEFVKQYGNDATLLNSVFYLKNNSPNEIIQTFIDDYLTIDTTGKHLQNKQRVPQVTWRDMQYLWKYFLETRNLPAVMFLQTLKTNLIEKLAIYYKEDVDSFLGISSKHLPEIQKFLFFWDETMVFDESESELEIDEIVILFRKWCNSNNETVSVLNDKQILDLISYFYPSVEIERDKYVSSTRCSLWDKQADIDSALQILKENIRSKYESEVTPAGRTRSPQIRNNVSIYDAYLFYCKHYSQTEYNQIVSKSYFEKYIFESLSQYIIDSKFLSVEWYTY
jgi:hypothetical protein